MSTGNSKHRVCAWTYKCPERRFSGQLLKGVWDTSESCELGGLANTHMRGAPFPIPEPVCTLTWVRVCEQRHQGELKNKTTQSRAGLSRPSPRSAVLSSCEPGGAVRRVGTQGPGCFLRAVGGRGGESGGGLSEDLPPFLCRLSVHPNHCSPSSAWTCGACPYLFPCWSLAHR